MGRQWVPRWLLRISGLARPLSPPASFPAQLPLDLRQVERDEHEIFAVFTNTMARPSNSAKVRDPGRGAGPSSVRAGGAVQARTAMQPRDGLGYSLRPKSRPP